LLGRVKVETLGWNRGAQAVSVPENRGNGVVGFVGNELAEAMAERFIVKQKYQEVLFTESGKISPLRWLGNVNERLETKGMTGNIENRKDGPNHRSRRMVKQGVLDMHGNPTPSADNLGCRCLQHVGGTLIGCLGHAGKGALLAEKVSQFRRQRNRVEWFTGMASAWFAFVCHNG